MTGEVPDSRFVVRKSTRSSRRRARLRNGAVAGVAAAGLVAAGIAAGAADAGPTNHPHAITAAAGAFASCAEWITLRGDDRVAISAGLIVNMRHGTGELALTDYTRPSHGRAVALAVAVDEFCGSTSDPARKAVVDVAATIYRASPDLHPGRPAAA